MGYCVGLAKIGQGFNLLGNPLQDYEMIDALTIGTDHLVRYLEERMKL